MLDFVSRDILDAIGRGSRTFGTASMGTGGTILATPETLTTFMTGPVGGDVDMFLDPTEFIRRFLSSCLASGGQGGIIKAVVFKQCARTLVVDTGTGGGH